MLSYETQLDLKRNVIIKAYKNFSGELYRIKMCDYPISSVLQGLPASAVPEIQPTIGSPLQYGYRTKITPHFENPQKMIKKHGLPVDEKPDWFKIGFNRIGSRHVIDIEVSLCCSTSLCATNRFFFRNVQSLRRSSMKRIDH